MGASETGRYWFFNILQYFNRLIRSVPKRWIRTNWRCKYLRIRLPVKHFSIILVSESLSSQVRNCNLCLNLYLQGSSKLYHRSEKRGVDQSILQKPAAINTHFIRKEQNVPPVKFFFCPINSPGMK